MKKSLLAVALLSCTMAAQAADQNEASALAPVLVTATRTAITADEALSSVTVITRADIERLQPLSVPDLLTGLPGVSFANTGGYGQQTSLFMRGTNSTHTLLLVDGVRVASVSAGLAAFEQIPVEQIERIEIVRGPRSSLYGADAIGGVIQIFTRRGTRDGGLRPSFSVTTGSDNLLRGQAGLSGGDRHAWYNFGVGAQYTRGINACRVGAGTVFAGCFTDEPDRDAYRNKNLSASGGYRWDNGAELTGTWLRSLGEIHFDGSYQNRSRTLQQVAGSSFSFNPLQAWKTTLSVGQNLDRYDNYENRDFVGYIYSRRNQASWQNDLSVASNQLLTLGVDWQGEHIDSDTGFLASRRNDTGWLRAVPGHVRPPRGAAVGATRPQRPVRRPQHRRRGVGLSLRRRAEVVGQLRQRVPCADLQRPVLPVRQRQSRPEAGKIAQRRAGPEPAAGGVELGAERLPDPHRPADRAGQQLLPVQHQQGAHPRRGRPARA